MYTHHSIDGWRKGRWWLHFGSHGRLSAEWVFLKGSHWSITIGGGDSGRALSICLSVPWLLTLYLTLDPVLPRPFKYDFDRGHDREISIYFFEGAIWWHIWVGTMASWSRSYPWCRWWRQGSFHFASLLGPTAYSVEVLEHGISVLIPMPEGIYRGVAKVEKQRWKRPLWFAKERVSTWIDVEKGIPFAGKGENSYDCGDDGLFGCGVDGRSIENAIGHYVASVLKYRHRYGKPSDEAIKNALAA